MVFDAPGRTFRDEAYPDYKAHRPRMASELAEQLGDLDAALRYAEQGYAVPPGRVQAGARAARLLIVMGRLGDALELAREDPEIAADPAIAPLLPR